MSLVFPGFRTALIKDNSSFRPKDFGAVLTSGRSLIIKTATSSGQRFSSSAISQIGLPSCHDLIAKKLEPFDRRTKQPEDENKQIKV